MFDWSWRMKDVESCHDMKGIFQIYPIHLSSKPRKDHSQYSSGSIENQI